MATADFEKRPWGEFSTYEDDGQDRFWVKKLTISPGQSLSLQKHELRDEFWVCVEGVLTVEVEGEKKELGPGEFVHINKKIAHRGSNESQKDVIFIEVAAGKCVESDETRLEDQYGRKSPGS